MTLQPDGTNPNARLADDRPYARADNPASAYGNAPVVTQVLTPRNGLGTAALVLGILALVTCWTVLGGLVLGVLAIVFGFIGRGRVTRGEATNSGSATAGIVTGLLGLVLAGALVAFGLSVLNSPSGKNLQQCLKNAGTDTAAVTLCQQQYNATTR